MATLLHEFFIFFSSRFDLSRNQVFCDYNFFLVMIIIILVFPALLHDFFHFLLCAIRSLMDPGIFQVSFNFHRSLFICICFFGQIISFDLRRSLFKVSFDIFIFYSLRFDLPRNWYFAFILFLFFVFWWVQHIKPIKIYLYIYKYKLTYIYIYIKIYVYISIYI